MDHSRIEGEEVIDAAFYVDGSGPKRVVVRVDLAFQHEDMEIKAHTFDRHGAAPS